LPRPIIPPKGYIREPVTIGEHIRKRRLDLGMTQADASRHIGVTESTVWNWEHGGEPELIHMPQIISFLGYIPFEMPQDPIGRLNYLKKLRGLSYEKLGKSMKRDPEQLTGWLSGRITPCQRNIKRIESFLSRSLPCVG
jgi:transcriptional regulator with XRE-family HTH domain